MNFFKNLQTGRKLFGIVLLISVIITGVLFGFVFLAKQQPQQEPAIGGSDPPMLDISDWQTYRNDEFGFEVKRPIEWIVENTNVVNPKSRSSFEITKNENSDNLSLDEWFRQATMVSGRPTVKATAERTIINGMPAYMLETELSPPNPLFEVVAIANSQSNIFSIHAYYEVQEDIETLNQILSTFRFLPSTDTATWAVYRNDEYNFELKYPAE